MLRGGGAAAGAPLGTARGTGLLEAGQHGLSLIVVQHWVQQRVEAGQGGHGGHGLSSGLGLASRATAAATAATASTGCAGARHHEKLLLELRQSGQTVHVVASDASHE